MQHSMFQNTFLASTVFKIILVLLENEYFYTYLSFFDCDVKHWRLAMYLLR